MLTGKDRLIWQDAPKAERMRICVFYMEYIRRTEGTITTVEHLDMAWFGCWFDVIKYTFGPDSWDLQ